MADSRNTVTHSEHRVLGMLAGLGAFLAFTVMNAFAKVLSEHHSVVEIAFYRNLVASVLFVSLMLGMGRREVFRIQSKPWLIGVRAVLGTVSLTASFFAYSLMPMADTTAFLFTSSLFVPVFGVFFLGERVGIYRWSAVLAGFAGVVIMLRPSGHTYALGVAVCLGAAVLQAALQIVLRYLGRFESPETVSLYFFMVGTCVTALPLPFVAVAPTLVELPLLLGVGISGAAAQWLLSTAFRNAPAAVVTVFNYSGIIWATLIGWMIWNEWPLPQVFAGAAIVIASNLLIIWRESRLHGITGARVRARL